MSKYLYAFDLSMDCSGITIFNLETLQPTYIGSIKTNDKQTHGQRLKYIEDKIIELTGDYPPDSIAIERGFSRFNISTQVIYRVHGIVNKYFYNVKQVYYPPKSVKESILKGNATKKQVRSEIEKVYPDVVFQNEDESDSFAVGLTHMIKTGKLKWHKEIEGKPKKTRKKKEA